jgi:phosphonoacetaldehyde hydrolase
MAFVKLFGKRGVPITIEEARGPMGMHKRDHIRAITRVEAVTRRWQQARGEAPDESDVEVLYAGFGPILLDILADYAVPIPGTVEAMAAFRERGLKIGSCTAYAREMMEVLVPESRRLGFAPDSVVSVSDVPAGRPEPWMALLSAMELRVYPMEAVVKVGDTLPDIAEGLNAGMWTVGVTQTGNGLGLSQAEVEALDPGDLRARLRSVRERMYAAGAHYVVKGIGDVPALLDEIDARLARGEHPTG